MARQQQSYLAREFQKLGSKEAGVIILIALALVFLYRYFFVGGSSGSSSKKAATTKRAPSTSAPRHTQKVPLPQQPTDLSAREIKEEQRRKEREWTAEVLPKKTTGPSPKATKNTKATKETKETKKQEVQTPPAPKSPVPSSTATPKGGSAVAKFAVGDTVTVAYRSEKGEPVKPGGEARVTLVSTGEDKTIRYNVSYVLGGREMGVAEKFISSETSLLLSTKKRVRTPSKPELATPGKKSKK